MFALGPAVAGCTRAATEGTRDFLKAKFGRKPEILAANLAAFEAGWAFGETTEDFAVQYEVEPGGHAARASTATSPATSRWPTG